MISITTNLIWSAEELKSMAILGAKQGTGSSGFEQTLLLKAFLDDEGSKLVAYIKDNIVKMGNGGGEWKPLTPAYEKRKAAGKTKGGGKFGVPAMLRDSGKSVAQIRAVVQVSREFSVGIMVPEVLGYHFRGEGRNPVRNPVSDAAMSAWNAGFNQRLDAFLSGRMAA